MSLLNKICSICILCLEDFYMKIENNVFGKSQDYSTAMPRQKKTSTSRKVGDRHMHVEGNMCHTVFDKQDE